ncbi:hypothetical protein P8452_04813 [Trifolium repens]|nr:hypothetical protein P8452_04813 [Trifolium repens]
MASSSSSRNVIIYAVDDDKPVIIDDSEFVSEPDMTAVEDNIWGEELMIPHKLGGWIRRSSAKDSQRQRCFQSQGNYHFDRHHYSCCNSEEITAQYWGQASKKEFNGDERDWRAHQAEETKDSYY